jgi:hypothetical protein
VGRKKASHSQPESLDSGRETHGIVANGKISKTDAVRAAIAEGHESPDDGIAFIKSRFGIEIGKPMFGSYKSQLKAKAGQSGVHKKGGRAPKEAAPIASVSAIARDDVGIVADLAAVKRLVEKLGVEQVRQMAGLFE